MPTAETELTRKRLPPLLRARRGKDRVDPSPAAHRPNQQALVRISGLYFDTSCLIDATVPKTSARSPAKSARSEIRVGRAGRVARPRKEKCRRPFIHRRRLFGYHHASGHSAEHSREPRLVHSVHTLPGGDCTGPPRSAPEFSDDDHRSDRSRYRECLLLDEGTAAPKAMRSARAVRPKNLLRSRTCHPKRSNRATRARLPSLKRDRDFRVSHRRHCFRALSNIPTDGAIRDYKSFAKSAPRWRLLVSLPTSCAHALKGYGRIGADVAVASRNAWRSAGFGGPHEPILRACAYSSYACRLVGVCTMRPAGPVTASPCKPANSTSAGTRRRVTFAPRRFSSL